jgi:hypothetical protein
MHWVDYCTTNHTRCKRLPTDFQWYPTRLLDIGISQAATDTVRLVVTAENAINGPYLTLSHCWGSAEFLQLTRSSLADFQKGIRYDHLPRTFQDCILIARRMKIRYIWIDSLCIMQGKDDLTDWFCEAALMHKVYSNSFCNISAMGAADSSSGLFITRDPDMLGSVEIELKLAGLETTETSTSYTLIDFLFWQNELSRAHLNRRAWVVQERLLAPRVLHFGEKQLFWECCEMDAAEKYPSGLPSALERGAMTKFKSLDPLIDGAKLRQRGPHDADSRFYAYQLWPRIVEAYSNCLLTNSGDKLIALSGIAKKMTEIIQDEYIAGMWRQYLESQLLWTVDECRQINDEPSKRPIEYRAPSFSWASIDGMINTAEITDKGMLIEVQEVKLDYVTSDQTGLVKGGYLRLNGTLKRLKIVRHPLGQPWIMVVNDVEARRRDGEEWERLGPLVHLDVHQADFNDSNEKQTLYCMPARAPHGRWTFLSCLILESIDEAAGTFRRIGMAMSHKAEVIQIQILLEHCDNEAGLPCEFYDRETRKHLIRVL